MYQRYVLVSVFRMLKDGKSRMFVPASYEAIIHGTNIVLNLPQFNINININNKKFSQT